jgi:uncharacterized protein
MSGTEGDSTDHAATPDPVPPRMLPPLTDANRAFWTGGANGELLILRCATCRRWVHPPAATCPDDGCALAPEAVSGRGTVFSFTVNRHIYNPAVPPPYVIAIVELDEQPNLRFTTNIVGCAPEDVAIGMPVTVTFEPHGEVFVPVFQPA